MTLSLGNRATVCLSARKRRSLRRIFWECYPCVYKLPISGTLVHRTILTQAVKPPQKTYLADRVDAVGPVREMEKSCHSCVRTRSKRCPVATIIQSVCRFSYT